MVRCGAVVVALMLRPSGNLQTTLGPHKGPNPAIVILAAALRRGSRIQFPSPHNSKEGVIALRIAVLSAILAVTHQQLPGGR